MPQLLNLVSSLRPDGVFLTPPHCDNGELAAWLGRQGMPIARLGHDEGLAHVDIHMDDAGAMREVTRFLLSLSHRRIGFVSEFSYCGPSSRRHASFCETLADAGVALAGADIGVD